MVHQMSLVRVIKSSHRLNTVSILRFQFNTLRGISHYSTVPSSPNQTYTKLTDSNDPKRNKFFQYTWGTWLKNDQFNKSKRETKFSIEGLDTIFQVLNENRSTSDKLSPPISKDNITLLSHNLNNELLGNTAGTKLQIKSIASIHEGKHHRVYKITLNTSKELILRIPYKLNSSFAIEQTIKSEVATMDFLDLKLKLKVPKIISFGFDMNNSLHSPFILQEFIPGDLLMKKWHPLLPDSTENEQSLKSVIDPIAKFQQSMLSFTFNKYGSLYFKNDVDSNLQNDLPYDNEPDQNLINRWRIGPSCESYLFKNKNKLSSNTINQFRGPWPATEPTQLMNSVCDIELENLKNRLSFIQGDIGGNQKNEHNLKMQIKTFENLKKIMPILINPNSKSIKNVTELFKPRLFAPDLDPLNVISSNDEFYFIDFEHSVIKPFILTNYPKFIAYNGAKVYDLHQDVPGFEEMDEVEKQQYEFMYYKTRNERLWELELNKSNHDLIAIASPHLKLLKSPYLQTINELKNDSDYLYIENSLIQLQSMWDTYVANDLVNTKEEAFPIEEYSDEKYLDEFQTHLSDYQMESVSSPFNATGGWIPQDMFETLKSQGMIVETDNGDYKIETEKVLQKTPEEEQQEQKQ